MTIRTNREWQRVKIKLAQEQAGLARAKKFTIYAEALSALLMAFDSNRIPGSYVQFGTTRIEMKSDGLAVEPTAAFATVHFSPKPSEKK